MKQLNIKIISLFVSPLFFSSFFSCAGEENGNNKTRDIRHDWENDTDMNNDDSPSAEEGSICVPGPEICNGVDDDCNGSIDDGIDLFSDPENCGACGWSCNLPHAGAKCENGACWVLHCEDGYFDVNGDPSDGCEYSCILEGTNEQRGESGTCFDGIDNDCDGRIDERDRDCTDCVPEFCDSVDNDCDDLVDEDFDFRFDPNHCGNCTTVCPDYPRAEGICVLGSCNITCQSGFSNLDGIIVNGCEAVCTPSSDPGESICDGIDNDCDGGIDEDYAPFVCGVGACTQLSICWEGEESCTPLTPQAILDRVCDGSDEDCDGSADEDYEPTDRCVGYCKTTAICVGGEEMCGTPLAPADSTCDSVDDDCDGSVDEDYLPYTCGTGVCSRQSTCVGGTEDCDEGPPAAEICNGSDDNCDGNVDNGNIATLCPTAPPNGTATCEGGRCVIGGCNTGYYDLDGRYENGCECRVESTEGNNNTCATAVDLGSFADNGTSTTITGNIVPGNDSDWYRFTASDSLDTSCDEFHVMVRFTSNPGNIFIMDVYRSSCSAQACSAEMEIYEWFADFRTGSGSSAVGECPCRPNPPGALVLTIRINFMSESIAPVPPR